MESPRKDSGGHDLSPQSSSPPRVAQSGLSSMPNTPPRSRSGSQLSPMAVSTSVQVQVDDPSRPLLQPAQVATPSLASRVLSAMPSSTTVAKAAKATAAVAAPTTDMAAAGLSISDVVNTTTNHPYTRGMLSGGLWAASGASSLVANKGQSTVPQVLTDVANIGAGLASMSATVADGQGSHSWTSYASYASNSAWVAAGLGAMYQGVQTMRDAKSSGWKKVSGGLQAASGLLNAGAGAAGIASTYFAEQNEHDPRAYSFGLASGVMWASASVFGAASAWAGSGSASQPVVQPPVNPSVQDQV
ncbi:MAG: hypothetical protein KF800_03510 [Lysobacter sp.]|nr:hypothetical protein [Lysobacter sp.]